MENNNPNLIRNFSDPVERLSKMFFVSDHGDIVGVDNSTEKALVGNASKIGETYTKGVEILTEAGFPLAVERLTAKLVPRFGKGRPKLRDQKIGGIPDLRKCLYVNKSKKGVYNLAEIWPKCGACHEPMRFIGQFDMLPWLLPIHAAFGEVKSPHGRRYVESQIGTGKLTDHSSIFSDRMLHVFACPEAGRHYCQPGFDSQIFVSDVYKSTYFGVEEPKLLEVDKEYTDSIPKLKRNRDGLKIPTRKIEGWEFRLELDDFRNEDWKDDKRLDGVINANPEVFCGIEDFSLFGAPRSQQEPRRYFGMNSYGGPKRMTPLLSFSDSVDDFTYQFYCDFDWSDGFEYYCKVDGSCT